MVTPRDNWRKRVAGHIFDPARRRCRWSYAYTPVINIHFLESTLITELKFHFFFSQVQWLIDNYETAECVSLVHVPPCTPIIWDTAMSTSWSQSMRQTDPFRFLGGSENQTTGHQVETFHLISQIISNWIHLFFDGKTEAIPSITITSFAYQTDVITESNVGRRWSPPSVQRHSSNGKRES